MDSGKITEHDGEMYCGSCYGKHFGPKGYGFGGGSGTLSMDDGKGYTVIKDLTTITLILIRITNIPHRLHILIDNSLSLIVKAHSC